MEQQLNELKSNAVKMANTAVSKMKSLYFTGKTLFKNGSMLFKILTCVWALLVILDLLTLNFLAAIADAIILYVWFVLEMYENVVDRLILENEQLTNKIAKMETTQDATECCGSCNAK